MKSKKIVTALCLLSPLFSYGRDDGKENIPSSSSVTDMSPGYKAVEHESGGLFEGFRFGPTIGVGILEGPVVTFEAKIEKRFGLSFGFSRYDLNLLRYGAVRSKFHSNEYKVNSLNMSYQQWEFRGTVYPFAQSFFVGLAIGNRKIQVNSSATLYPVENGVSLDVPISLQLQVQSVYLTPQVGWLAVWDGNYGGFALGTDFGLQVAVDNTVTVNAAIQNVDPINNVLIQESSQYQSYKQQAGHDVGKIFKNYPMPYWTIIRLGWLF